jgi:hypothetical protein
MADQPVTVTLADLFST